jgi:hypothetical protein
MEYNNSDLVLSITKLAELYHGTKNFLKSLLLKIWQWGGAV